MKKIIYSIFLLSFAAFSADIIKVGMTNDYPPFEYVDGGNIVGFDADFTKMLFDKMGMQYEIAPVSYDTACSDLNSGKINVAISAFRNGRFTKDCTMSDAYYESKIIFLSKEESGYKSLSDLNNTEIGYVNGEKLLKTIESFNAKAEKRNSLAGLVLSMQDGKINGILTNLLSAQNIINGDFSKFPKKDQDKYAMLKNLGMNKKMTMFPVNEDVTLYFFVMFPKDAPKELLDKVNKAIVDLKEKKELEQLVKKYSTL